MRVYDRFELPPDKAALHRRAVRLEWWTIGFFAVAVSLLAVTLGQSQAMKARGPVVDRRGRRPDHRR